MRLSAPIYLLKRRAKRLAQEEKIPLHQALDRIAIQQGFGRWSLLSSRMAMSPPSEAILSRLENGDLMLLAARPGHGKTMLALQLLRDAVRASRRAVFFSLEFTEHQARERLVALEDDGVRLSDKIEIVTSDDISADYIVDYLADAQPGILAIIDYLQILDQKRSKPILSDQMLSLQGFARRTGAILGFISQIDRSFDAANQPLPGAEHIRLPNPIGTGIFSKMCFLHEGEVRFRDVA